MDLKIFGGDCGALQYYDRKDYAPQKKRNAFTFMRSKENQEIILKGKIDKNETFIDYAFNCMHVFV